MFDGQSNTFNQVKAFDIVQIDKLKSLEKGRNSEDIKKLLTKYGLNSIKVEITPIYILFYRTVRLNHLIEI